MKKEESYTGGTVVGAGLLFGAIVGGVAAFFWGMQGFIIGGLIGFSIMVLGALGRATESEEKNKNSQGVESLSAPDSSREEAMAKASSSGAFDETYPMENYFDNTTGCIYNLKLYQLILFVSFILYLIGVAIPSSSIAKYFIFEKSYSILYSIINIKEFFILKVLFTLYIIAFPLVNIIPLATATYLNKISYKTIYLIKIIFDFRYIGIILLYSIIFVSDYFISKKFTVNIGGFFLFISYILFLLPLNKFCKNNLFIKNNIKYNKFDKINNNISNIIGKFIKTTVSILAISIFCLYIYNKYIANNDKYKNSLTGESENIEKYNSSTGSNENYELNWFKDNYKIMHSHLKNEIKYDIEYDVGKYCLEVSGRNEGRFNRCLGMAVVVIEELKQEGYIY